MGNKRFYGDGLITVSAIRKRYYSEYSGLIVTAQILDMSVVREQKNNSKQSFKP